MSEREAGGPADKTEACLPAEAVDKPLSTKGSFGTAVGAAMHGFEQALREMSPHRR